MWYLLVGLGLVACQSAPAQPPTQVVVVLPTATLSPTETAVLTPPSVFLAPDNRVSKEDPGMAVPPTITAVPTSSPTPIPDTTTNILPTFTPPPFTQTVSQDHFWLQRPVAQGSTNWTDKTYPYGSTQGGALRTHHGVEFYVPTGTEILAATSGTVRVAGDDSAVPYGPQTNFYGNLVVIEADTSYGGQALYTLYGHLSQVLVSEGQHVDSQELIALSGASGVASGPHLHFEVRLGQNSYDHTRNPSLWLAPYPDYGAIAGRVVWPSGELAREAAVSILRIDGSRYMATTTYADNSVNSDGLFGENFVLDDVPAGFYKLTVQTASKTKTVEIWVYADRTSFVEIKLNW